MTAGSYRRRGSAVAAALACLALLLAGCASLPTDGPVRAGDEPEGVPSDAPFDFNPPGPEPGAAPVEVVSGFLLALQGTPSNTKVASEFLTTEAAERWRPERSTVVHQGQALAPERTSITVELDGAFELDRFGRWDTDSPVTASGTAEIPIALVRQEGEWRITDPPDATIIPASHFGTRYREYSLYFFDITGSLLVPEPVYLPWGVRAPTLLLEGLVAGPRGVGRLVQRSFIPQGTRLGVAVPVSRDGLAEVPLSEEMSGLEDPQLERALAQLGWTLGQVSEVSSFRVSVDGTPLDLPGADIADVDEWRQFAPWVATATDDLFGLRGRRVVQRVGDTLLEVAALGEQGREDPLRSVGVSMSGQRFAVVAADGTSVTAGGRPDSGLPTRTVYAGRDVFRPIWDRTERLWLLDRTERGARLLVSQARRPGELAELTGEGLVGRQLSAATLSRDGTTFVAVREDDQGPVVVLSRVVRNADGAPLRLTPARQVALPTQLSDVRDVGWRDPTTIAVLQHASPTTSEVLLASVDGSSGRIDLDARVDVLFDKVTWLASSPAPPTPLLVATSGGRVHALDAQGRWDLDALDPGMRAPTFVG